MIRKLSILLQISAQNTNFFRGLLRILSLCPKNRVIPELFCVDIQRHARDLGVSVVLPANCELTARREALRLFPEFKHNLVLMQVSLAQYVELDWDIGRHIVVKREKRPELPFYTAAAKRERKRLPRPDEEGGAA